MRQHNTGRTHRRHKVRRSLHNAHRRPAGSLQKRGAQRSYERAGPACFRSRLRKRRSTRKDQIPGRPRMPRTGCMLPHGYGQHDADTGRRPWHGTSRVLDSSCCISGKREIRNPDGKTDSRAGKGKHQAERHSHKGGAPQRSHPDHGAGRLHQCGAPSPQHSEGSRS